MLGRDKGNPVLQLLKYYRNYGRFPPQLMGNALITCRNLLITCGNLLITCSNAIPHLRHTSTNTYDVNILAYKYDK